MTGLVRATRSQPKSAARSTPSASTMSAASARVNVSVLYQFVDTANRPWPTSVAPRRGSLPGRVARGSVAPRKMACRPAAREACIHRFKAINSRTEEGAAWSLPLSNPRAEMDAKTRDLVPRKRRLSARSPTH